MASSHRSHPAEVGPNHDASALQIRWQDGHVSEYAPRDLRMACPCAGCVDEMTGHRTLTEAQVPVDIHPLAIHYVGRYALRFDWSDGHSTGIFPFDFLRDLCGCLECREVGGRGDGSPESLPDGGR